jgi:hypothetical protein
MIQRIQSIFLLAVATLQGAMLVTTHADILTGPHKVSFKAYGFISDTLMVENSYYSWFIFVFILLTALLPLVTVFIYKNRMLQIRLTVYNLILLAGYQGVSFWFLHQAGTKLNAVVSYHFPFVFPVVSLILCYLALRYIQKDEKKVRSLDRIR